MPRAEAAAPLLGAVVSDSVEVSIATATILVPEATSGSPGLSERTSEALVTQDTERRRTMRYGADADMERAEIERAPCEVVEEGEVASQVSQEAGQRERSVRSVRMAELWLHLLVVGMLMQQISWWSYHFFFRSRPPNMLVLVLDFLGILAVLVGALGFNCCVEHSVDWTCTERCCWFGGSLGFYIVFQLPAMWSLGHGYHADAVVYGCLSHILLLIFLLVAVPWELAAMRRAAQMPMLWAERGSVPGCAQGCLWPCLLCDEVWCNNKQGHCCEGLCNNEQCHCCVGVCCALRLFAI